jgi:hypothetical protein
MKDRHFRTFRIRSRKLREDKQLLNPALLRINKQIYAEALPLLYHQPLHFEDSAALYYFLVQIGKNAVHFIHDITINHCTVGQPSGLTHPAFIILLQVTNLNSLQILRLLTCHESNAELKQKFG